MTDDLPQIDELEQGDTVRVIYISQRSGNEVTREGDVAEVVHTEQGEPIVYVHDERRGFFNHTFVVLAPGTAGDDEAIVAVSVTTEPMWDGSEPADVNTTFAVTHATARRQGLGKTTKVIRLTTGALTPNDVL